MKNFIIKFFVNVCIFSRIIKFCILLFIYFYLFIFYLLYSLYNIINLYSFSLFSGNCKNKINDNKIMIIKLDFMIINYDNKEILLIKNF